MERKTKIVATLGPASDSLDSVRNILLAGVNVARMNFSHGTHQDHAGRINLLRTLASELKIPLCIVQDLQGPKIRIGDLLGTIQLTPGQVVILSTNQPNNLQPKQLDDQPVILPVDLPELPQSVDPGNRILIDDGHFEIEVDKIIDEHTVTATVITGGPLTSHKGVNLPGAHLTIPCMTSKDHVDLLFGLQQGIDAVAMSFVRNAEDIVSVRKVIQENSPDMIDIPIIAKLERPEALDHLDEILEVTDGVMVARGDLGVEMSPATVPIAQKKIIEAANRHLKIVITATQMLDSMIQNPRPTRAEASDVANAIFDGTDAVMLSGETAIGKYPREAVSMMGAIACQAEDHYSEWGFYHPVEEETTDDAVSLTHAARELAHDRNVAAIAVFTQTGRTALLMSKARPGVPILAFTPNQRTYQRMALYWGVIPFVVPFVSNMEALIQIVERAMTSSNLIQPGQQVILISGFPVGEMRLPNFALLHTVSKKEQ